MKPTHILGLHLGGRNGASRHLYVVDDFGNAVSIDPAQFNASSADFKSAH